jgi:hypothetical protein
MYKKLLSPELQKRVAGYLDERERALARGWFMPRYVQAGEDARLLDLAGEVARELEKTGST